MRSQLFTDGLFEFFERFFEHLLFVRVVGVSTNVVEKKRHFSAVLHWRDEKISQQQPMTPLILFTKLTTSHTCLRVKRAAFIICLRRQQALCFPIIRPSVRCPPVNTYFT